MKKILLLLISIMLIPTALLFAGGENEGGSDKSQVLVFGRGSAPNGLDPARETDGESFTVTGEIYEGLVSFKPGTTEVEPALAESWEYSNDDLTLTFKIRQGVKFHDGTDLNADAVVFNFKRQYDETNEYNQYGPWKYWGYMAFDAIIESVEAVDEYTVQLNLLKKDASLISTLAMDFLGIASPTAVETHKENFTNNPVGTGPFKFVSWTKGDTSILEANQDYWKGAPQLDKIVFKVIPEPTARALALKNGEVDIFAYPSPDDIADLDSQDDLTLYEATGLNLGYLAFNTQKKPFDDVRVRQALNHAIDKEAIIRAAYGDLGSPLDAPLPPSIWAYHPNVDKYEYDPAKAKALLAEAGYADGFEAELWPLPVSRPYMPQGKKVAEIIQQQFAEVGVTSNIQVLEWGAHLEGTDQGEHEMAFLGWTGDNGDPDNFLGVLLSASRAVVPASNIAFWKNAEFTALIDEAVIITDIEKRKELYFQAQEIFVKEVPWAVIANSKSIIPMNKKVKGFIYTPVGEINNLYYVSIEE